MMDEELEKTRGFSFYFGLSIVGHVIVLLLVLIFNPTPTKAKFQKSGVRVGVKFASINQIVQPSASPLITTPQKKPEASSQTKKKTVTKVTTPKKILVSHFHAQGSKAELFGVPGDSVLRKIIDEYKDDETKDKDFLPPDL